MEVWSFISVKNHSPLSQFPQGYCRFITLFQFFFKKLLLLVHSRTLDTTQRSRFNSTFNCLFFCIWVSLSVHDLIHLLATNCSKQPLHECRKWLKWKIQDESVGYGPCMTVWDLFNDTWMIPHNPLLFVPEVQFSSQCLFCPCCPRCGIWSTHTRVSSERRQSRSESIMVQLSGTLSKLIIYWRQWNRAAAEYVDTTATFSNNSKKEWTIFHNSPKSKETSWNSFYWFTNYS